MMVAELVVTIQSIVIKVRRRLAQRFFQLAIDFKTVEFRINQREVVAITWGNMRVSQRHKILLIINVRRQQARACGALPATSGPSVAGHEAGGTARARYAQHSGLSHYPPSAYAA
jgi:hypothetical protein